MNPSKISFTIDGWSSIAHRSYYGITGHFINDNWVLHSFVIDFVASNGHHTGRDIAQVFYTTLRKYKIENKLQGITVDNASANTKFMEELSKIMLDFDAKDQHYRCIAYILNLGAQAMLTILRIDDIKETDESALSSEEEDQIDEYYENSEDENYGNETEFYSEEKRRTSPLSKLRTLFSLLKNSEQWRNKLNICCTICNIKMMSPNIDVSTRWNSTFVMLMLAFRMKAALIMLCQNNMELKHLCITAYEWCVLEEATKYLQHFKVLSERLSGEKYVTLPSVIVGFNLLIDKLEKAKKDLIVKHKRTPVEENILDALEAALEKLLKHYKKCHWVYCAVLMLDPRHKKETFKLTAWGKEMAKESVKKFEDIYKNQYYKPQIDLESENEVLETTLKDKNNDILDVDVLYESDSDPEESQNSSAHKTATGPMAWRWELDLYLSQKRAGKHTDVLKWWEKHDKLFPNLARMARDFLCTPATSVPSERLFSRSSLVVRKHRNRLADKSITHLMCLNSWNACSLTIDFND